MDGADALAPNQDNLSGDLAKMDTLHSPSGNCAYAIDHTKRRLVQTGATTK